MMLLQSESGCSPSKYIVLIACSAIPNLYAGVGYSLSSHH
jgi:hypothetical protein